MSAVKILIRRKVFLEVEQHLSELLKEMRTLATINKGYISGETFKRIDQPGESLVVSNWRSVDDWKAWLRSPQRKELQDKIDALLGTETIYEEYVYS